MKEQFKDQIRGAECGGSLAIGARCGCQVCPDADGVSGNGRFGACFGVGGSGFDEVAAERIAIPGDGLIVVADDQSDAGED